MTPYRHIVWDWNGTLLDDVQASVNTINRLLAARALPRTDTAAYRGLFGFPVRNYYAAMGFRLEQENWDLLARTYHDYYLAEPSIRLHPETPGVLRFCSDAGLGQSILSASEQEILERMLAAAGILPWFDFIHGVDNLHGHSKVETGRNLIRRIPCPAAQVLFVGDTLHDHEVAAALGCDCVLVSQGHQAPARLQAAGCPVLDTLAMLPEFLRHAAPGCSAWKRQLPVIGVR
ncbi:MAG: HAD family hydrolase [bacterium]